MKDSKRVEMTEVDVESRIKNFEEVALGYTEEQAVKEAERCLGCLKPACVLGCPVKNDIPAFIKLIKERKFIEAYWVLKKTNCIPAVTGRVCQQEVQCEARCVRGRIGQPVAIGNLERFVADYYAKNATFTPSVLSENGKKVAVIGSGPSGLACASDLRDLGYKVTVFEAMVKPGGILVYGIPEFCLPDEVVAKEIETLKSKGIEFLTDVVVGRSVTIEDLFKQGFSAVYVASGANSPTFMEIEGEDSFGVLSANEFLYRITYLKNTDKDTLGEQYSGKTVVVVGGGNVAVDAARCAVRVAKKVILLYRRSRNELPARKEEIRHAEEEGVEYRFLTTPVKILSDEEGKTIGVECIKTELVDLKDGSRPRPRAIIGSNYIIPTDYVVMAIGSSSNTTVFGGTQGVELSDRRYVVCENGGKTSKKGVFAGGDAVTGPSTVIEAMGAGRKAAKEIDEYLKGTKF